MLHAIVACGEMSEHTFFWSPQQVRSLFGGKYGEVVERVSRLESVPGFENLAGATWHVVAPEGAVTVKSYPAGEEVSVADAGVFNLREYAAKFEAAVEARDFAVQRRRLTDFDAATFHGVASVEAFLNWQRGMWDHIHPANPLPTTGKRMSLDQKIRMWIPLLATGSILDYRQISWDKFFEIKRLRNQGTHATAPATGATLLELARRINLFGEGIATPFMQLHQVFHEPIPAVVIRAAYAPEVYVDDAQVRPA